jgi:hypothetical protein
MKLISCTSSEYHQKPDVFNILTGIDIILRFAFSLIEVRITNGKKNKTDCKFSNFK